MLEHLGADQAVMDEAHVSHRHDLDIGPLDAFQKSAQIASWMSLVDHLTPEMKFGVRSGVLFEGKGVRLMEERNCGDSLLQRSPPHSRASNICPISPRCSASCCCR